MSSDAVTVFFSYSHKDEALRNELANHLQSLKYSGDISDWHDRKILPGDEWDRDIKDKLNTAQVILLLISSDFIASSYCYDVEITRAMARHEAGEAWVIPIILRHCMWTSMPFGKLQALPKNAVPVTDIKVWGTKDQAFTDVAEGIKKTARQVRQKLKAIQQDKLNQYEAAYQSAIQQAYPLGEAVQGQLNRLQQALDLADADIAAIVTRLSAQYGAARQKLERYRHEVRLCLEEDNGEISAFSRTLLAGFRNSFGLTPEEATAVEQEELEPYRAKAEAIEQYTQVFADALAQKPVISDGMRSRLQRFQKSLGLTDAQVEAIESAHQKAAQAQAEAEQQRQAAIAVAEQQRQRESAEAERKTQQELAAARQRQAELAQRQATAQHAQPTVRRASPRESFTEDLGNGVTLEMVAIPAGEFMMGSPSGEKERRDTEGPQHKVSVPEFWMGKFPVTQAQYQAVMGKNPSHFTENGANRPVEQVSWHDAIAFCERLSQHAGRTYRLPSEAEWEYACRAGTTTRYAFGESISAQQVNCDFRQEVTVSEGFLGIGRKTERRGPYLAQTSSVGRDPANGFGLHDLHGNVWEWCQDHWHDNYEGAPADGSAWLTDNEEASRVRRGGSWFDTPRYCRSACRYICYPGFRNFSFGFRVVCSAPRAS